MDTTQIKSNTYFGNNDTICAISTPQGIGGIAVIRVSGKNAIDIVNSVYKGSDLTKALSHTAKYGIIYDKATDEDIDEVVCLIFKGPHSFTGENTVEISCHGSLWIQQQIVQLLIRNGCRMAQPGEFTRRAFANGKIDLSQAEAVADVIASTSAASHRVALNQLRGDFSNSIRTLRQSLIEFASLMELELDFSEEEVEFADRTKLLNLAKSIEQRISSLCNSFSTGNAIKNGIPVAIVGETNVGKSTLLNTLLHDNKAIVSDIHGTTRDIIEDTITINGMLFRFIDTAGLRETRDVVESIGIDLTLKKISQANIIIWMIDTTQHTPNLSKTASKILPLQPSQQLIIALNKTDISSEASVAELNATLNEIIADTPHHTISISAMTGNGINRLETLLTTHCGISEAYAEQTIVTNIRHYQALTLAHESICRAIDGLQSGLSGDFVSQDIRETTHHLGEITGEITTDTLLSTIFSRFCIGK